MRELISKEKDEEKPAVWEGRVVEGFVLELCLGYGPRSVVYRARHPESGDAVAIKFYEVREEEAEEAFERLRQGLQTIRSRQLEGWIIPRSIGRFGRYLYLVTDYLPGKGLDVLCREGGVSPSVAVVFLRQAAVALERGHRTGLVHGNLKPSNLIVTEEGRVLVRDPRCLTLVEESGWESFSEQTPEQRKGQEGQEVGERADVFGLGVVLHALLTGVMPQWLGKGGKRRGWPYMIAPGSLNRRLSSAVETVCLRALHRRPKYRYRGVLELCEDLERAVREEPTAASPPSLWSRAVSLAWQWPGVVAAALAGFVVAGGLTGLSVYTALDLQDDLWRAQANMVQAETALGRREEALRWLRQAVAWRRTPELREVAIRTLLLPEARPIASFSSRGEVDGYAWGPEGRYLLAAEHQEQNDRDRPVRGLLRVFDIISRRVVLSTEWDPRAGLPVFHPTERWFVVPTPAKKLQIWTVGEKQPVDELDAWGVSVFSPTGDHLAVADRQRVWVFNLQRRSLVGQRSCKGLIGWLDAHTLILRHGSGLVFWDFSKHTNRVLTPKGETIVAVSPNARWSLWATQGAPPTEQWMRVVLRRLPEGVLIGVVPGLRIPYVPYPMEFDGRGKRLFVPDPQDRSLLRIYRIPDLEQEGSLIVEGLVMDYRTRGWFVPVSGQQERYQWQEAVTVDLASPWMQMTSTLGSDGRLLAVTGFAGENFVEVWDVEGGRKIDRLRGCTLPTWDRHGIHLAVRQARLEKPEPTFGIAQGPQLSVWGVEIPSPTVRVGGLIRQLVFVNPNQIAADGRYVRILPLPKSYKLQLSNQSAAGETIFPCWNQKWWSMESVLYRGHRALRFTHEPSGEKVVYVPARGRSQTGIVFPTGDYAVVAQLQLQDPSSGRWTEQGELELWDLDRGIRTRQTKILTPVRDEGKLILSADGRWMAGDFYQDRSIQFWRIEGTRFQPALRISMKKLLQEVHAASDSHLCCMVISGNNDLCFLGLTDGTVVAWDLIDGSLLWHQWTVEGPIAALAVSPAEPLLAVVDATGQLRFYFSRSGTAAAKWPLDGFRTTAMTFDPTGRFLAVGSDEGWLKLFDLTMIRRQLATLGLGW